MVGTTGIARAVSFGDVVEELKGPQSRFPVALTVGVQHAPASRERREMEHEMKLHLSRADAKSAATLRALTSAQKTQALAATAARAAGLTVNSSGLQRRSSISGIGGSSSTETITQTLIEDTGGQIGTINDQIVEGELTIFRRELTEQEQSALLLQLGSNHSRIKRLSLYRNKLPRSTVLSIFEAVANNSTLTHLSVRDNNVDDECAEKLGKALRTNQTLTHLSLRDNAISGGGARWLAEGLRSNSVMIDLSLRNNMVDDAGLVQLGDLLKVNSSLEVISVYDNPFTNGKAIKSAAAKVSNCRFSTAPLFALPRA